MKKLDLSVFESIVKEAAIGSPRLLDVVVKGFEVFATYESGSRKIKQGAHLIFDESGKFIAGYGNRAANAPKFLVDRILDIIKEKIS
jgi:hypothetical protein